MDGIMVLLNAAADDLFDAIDDNDNEESGGMYCYRRGEEVVPILIQIFVIVSS